MMPSRRSRSTSESSIPYRVDALPIDPVSRPEAARLQRQGPTHNRQQTDRNPQYSIND